MRQELEKSDRKMVIVQLLGGLVLLLVGGEALVRGSVAVASRLVFQSCLLA